MTFNDITHLSARPAVQSALFLHLSLEGETVNEGVEVRFFRHQLREGEGAKAALMIMAERAIDRMLAKKTP